MNVYILSAILGIIEGLTEFLPVSSTAHLRIAEALMKIDLDDAYWKMYTIVIQAGAILALLLLYLGRILEFVRTFPRGERGDRNILTHPLSLTIFAFICTSVPACAVRPTGPAAADRSAPIFHWLRTSFSTPSRARMTSTRSMD